MAAAVAVLLVVGAALACLLPLFSAREDDDLTGARDAAGNGSAAELDRLLAALKDADLDLAMGKLTPAEHAESRRDLEAQVLRAMAAIDAESAEARRGAGGSAGASA